ncbi:MAG: PilZ domain-containing protein [Spirochaetia bacterium]|nr:PilZ domain-containing protein [Spirochaetia bacterium]
MLDKRQHQRIRYFKHCEIVTRAGRVYEGVVFDISMSGVGMLARTSLPLGECLIRHNAWVAPGEIVYCNPSHRHKPTGSVFRCGIHFLIPLNRAEFASLANGP